MADTGRDISGKAEQVREGILRPTHLFHEINRALKSHKPWRIYDEARARRAQLGNWPAWCFCPHEMIDDASRKLRYQDANPTYVLLAFAAWRPTQGVYRFDETLRDELWETPLEGDLPVELLRRLPEWCVYIEVDREVVIPDFGSEPERDHLHGFFAHAQYNPMDERESMHFVLDFERELCFTLLPLKGTLKSSIKSMILPRLAGKDDSQFVLSAPSKQMLNPLVEVFSGLVNLVLYLCESEPEITDQHGRAYKPLIPAAVKPTKRKAKGADPRLHAAQETTAWEVGYRIGAAIRRARAERHEEDDTEDEPADPDGQPRRTRRPIGHIRRAHWHTYWVGPKSDPSRRRRVLKWVPPVRVNLDDIEQLIPALRPVKE